MKIQCDKCHNYYNPQTVSQCPLCKLNSVKPILNSPNTSAQETTGNVLDAEKYSFPQHKAYKILIFGDEAERTRALTQIIAIPCVSVVINTGEEMDGKIISNLRKSNSEKVVIRN